MKIYIGSGTPIWIAPRRNDEGVIVMQGTSRIMLRNEEIAPFIEAIRDISGATTTT